MNNLSDMIWIEFRKAIRSGMPLWTGLGSLFMPLGIAFLIFVSKNTEISKKLGLVSAKADLMAYSATDWTTYLGFFGMLLAAGGFILFVLINSWVFGREFSDRTLKDMLAVPVHRSKIVLAKFIVTAIWSAVISIEISLVGLAMGAIIKLPGFSVNLFLQGSSLLAITSAMAIIVSLPFALFASAGRGYLLPIGLAVLTMMMTNLVAIAGWGEFFPWAVPGLYAQGKDILQPISFIIVILTGLAGMYATYLWWMNTDQSK
jgi:ABC-2 type transport system permease protein